MELFRIVNFSIQLLYLGGHFLFILALCRRRQPTPVWFWFFCLCAAAWIWVSGRFLESIVYIFFPGNAPFYRFAANYQYLGNCTAVAFYLLWVLYLCGYDRLADTGWFRALLFACPAVICTLVFTNPWHHLFYTKLEMNQRVGHGPLFVPCLIWVGLYVLAGYAASIRFVLANGRDHIRQLVLFSLFPLTPLIAVLIRSASGVDRLDYTPVVMAVSFVSLYHLVFTYQYVHIVSASIRDVLEQTSHPIGIYDPARGECTYANRAAGREYRDILEQLLKTAPETAGRIEGDFGGRRLLLETAPLPEEGTILAAVSDITDIAGEQAKLERQIRELEKLGRELEEAGRNIDAYLEAMPDAEGLRGKQTLIDEAWTLAGQAFRRVEENLKTAGRDPGRAEEVLRENLDLTRECIAAIRRAVAQLGEGSYGQI